MVKDQMDSKFAYNLNNQIQYLKEKYGKGKFIITQEMKIEIKDYGIRWMWENNYGNINMQTIIRIYPTEFEMEQVLKHGDVVLAVALEDIEDSKLDEFIKTIDSLLKNTVPLSLFYL